MPKVEKHPSGATIVFDSKWHSYKCPQKPGLKFTSGTKFLSKFYPAFDKEGISKRYAEKNGLSQIEVLAQWARKGEVSRESGTLVHNYLENLANGLVLKHENAARHPDEEIAAMALSKMKCADKLLNEIVDTYEILKPEMIVASLGRAVAGQVDLVARRKDNGAFAFFDYKTNEEIKFENRWQRCLAPVDHFEHCNFIEYTLQLGLYEFIAKEEGYLDALGWNGDEVDRYIVHITGGVDKGMIYPCADVSGEIGEMFNEKRSC
jgi:hypothetical protein